MSKESKSEIPWSPQLAHELRTLQFALEFVDSINRSKCDQQEHKERALKIAQGFIDSLNKAVMAEQEPPTIPISQQKDSRTIRLTIADVDTDNVRISVVITAKEDGGLRIDDWSMGTVADRMYGEGSDVESWITVSSEATRKLSVKLFHDWVDEPAEKVEKYLAARFLGDTKAVSQIEELLKSLDVKYERQIWI